MIAPTWRRRWDEVTPFLAFPQEIRRAIYTTNAIEALNRQLRKVLKVRGHMPNEQAALKLLYMAERAEELGRPRSTLEHGAATVRHLLRGTHSGMTTHRRPGTQKR